MVVQVVCGTGCVFMLGCEQCSVMLLSVKKLAAKRCCLLDQNALALPFASAPQGCEYNFTRGRIDKQINMDDLHTMRSLSIASQSLVFGIKQPRDTA